MSSIAAIEAAATRLKGHVIETPLLRAEALDALAGRRVWVKAECLQVTGSFKARGGWAAVSALEAPGGVLALSSGNHAQGVARAAAAMGRAAVIVMPADAPEVKIANTRAHGAEVVLYDRATEDREAIGAALARERGLHLIPPFDHAEVIAGQGTVGLEIAAQARAAGISRADVLVPCGGGGLCSGVALALEGHAPGLRVRPVEPEGFDDAARSLASGAIATNTARTGSVCDAILSPRLGDLTFPILLRLAGPGLVVRDAEALAAMRAAFTDLHIAVEPGGAVALAAALFRAKEISGEDVIVIASGGNVDSTLFARQIGADSFAALRRL